MSQQVTITYFGVEATGRNVTEAKRAAGKRIEEMIAGDYSPVIVSHRGVAILVYRTPSNNWSTVRICDEDGFRDGVLIGGGCYVDSREDTIRGAKEHLAQITWQPEDGTNPPAFLTDRRSIADFKIWTEFQLRYREAVSRGMDSNDAHSYAGRNPSRPELWAA